MEALFLETVDNALERSVTESDPTSDRASVFSSVLAIVRDVVAHHQTKYSATATAADWFRMAQTVRNIRDTLLAVNSLTAGDPDKIVAAVDAVDTLIDELDLIRELARHLEGVRGRPGSVSEDLFALKRFRREVRTAFEEVLKNIAALAAG